MEDLARKAGELAAAGTMANVPEARAVMQVLQARSAYESAVVNRDLVRKTPNGTLLVLHRRILKPGARTSPTEGTELELAH